MNMNENHQVRQNPRDPRQPSRVEYAATYRSAPVSQSSLYPAREPKNVSPPPTKRTAQPKSRMPKARAQALVRVFKRWIVMASLVGFLSLSGLATLHRTGATMAPSAHVASATTTTAKKVVTVKATAKPTVSAKPTTSAKATTRKKESAQPTATPTHSSYSFGVSTPTPVTTSNVS